MQSNQRVKAITKMAKARAKQLTAQQGPQLLTERQQLANFKSDLASGAKKIVSMLTEGKLESARRYLNAMAKIEKSLKGKSNG